MDLYRTYGKMSNMHFLSIISVNTPSQPITRQYTKCGFRSFISDVVERIWRNHHWSPLSTFNKEFRVVRHFSIRHHFLLHFIKLKTSLLL